MSTLARDIDDVAAHGSGSSGDGDSHSCVLSIQLDITSKDPRAG